jgi:hypothetical protein
VPLPLTAHQPSSSQAQLPVHQRNQLFEGRFIAGAPGPEPSRDVVSRGRFHAIAADAVRKKRFILHPALLFGGPFGASPPEAAYRAGRGFGAIEGGPTQRRFGMAVVVSAFSLWLPMATVDGSAQTNKLTPLSQTTVRRAIELARAKLALPGCSHICTDFELQPGVTPRTELERMGIGPEQFLETLV